MASTSNTISLVSGNNTFILQLRKKDWSMGVSSSENEWLTICFNMEYVNYRSLPEYVFAEQYEHFIFINFDDFFSLKRAEVFMTFYCNALKALRDTSFELFEILEDKDKLILVDTYQIDLLSPHQIAEQLLNVNFNGMQHYLTIAFMRGVFATKSNKLCVYLERDLEVIIVGCSKDVTKYFEVENEFLEVMDLNGYIRMLEIFYQHKEINFLTEIKEKLHKNYL